MATEVPSSCSQQITSCAYREPDELFPRPHTLSLKYIAYYPSIYAWVFQLFFSPSLFTTKSFIHQSSSPFVLHAPPISSSLVWSLELYSVRSKLPWYVGPCHHGMARPQVADGGTACHIEGSCEYIEHRQGLSLSTRDKEQARHAEHEMIRDYVCSLNFDFIFVCPFWNK